MDFEAIASGFGVKPEVIETLFNEIPFQDVFDGIVGCGSPERFWDYVDSLPRRIAMKLHSIQLRIDVATSDFPKETMTPILQSFWAANLISEGKTPETVNQQGITQLNTDQLYEILKGSGGEPQGEKEFAFGGQVFTVSTLLDLCNCAISGGRTWLFCEIPEVRAAYCVFADLIENINPRFVYLRSRILEKMRNMAYISSAEMAADAEAAEIGQFPDFEISDEIRNFFVTLIGEARKVFEMPGRAPEISPMNEWISSRTEALMAQMSLPLQQRAAFILTPQILQARSGMSPDFAFDPLSLPELLFSDSDGDVSPMPFGTTVELPSTSPTVYARSVFRKFAAKRLLASGYSSASDISLDILADVIMNEAKKITQTAVVISDPHVSSKACMEQALKDCGYQNVLLMNSEL